MIHFVSLDSNNTRIRPPNMTISNFFRNWFHIFPWPYSWPSYMTLQYIFYRYTAVSFEMIHYQPIRARIILFHFTSTTSLSQRAWLYTDSSNLFTCTPYASRPLIHYPPVLYLYKWHQRPDTKNLERKSRTSHVPIAHTQLILLSTFLVMLLSI